MVFYQYEHVQALIVLMGALENYCAKVAKEKFKNLKDVYRRIIQGENRPSGSEANDMEHWRYYEVIEFLRDSCLLREYDFIFKVLVLTLIILY